MKVGIVSDTHGFLDPRVVEAVRGCALVVHAGDVGSADVLEQLAETGADVLAVVGNNDVARKWKGATRAMRALAEQHRITLPGGDLVVVHGHRVLPASRRHQRLRDAFPDARGIVYGHSHHRIVDKAVRPWVINPGAAGKSRTFGGPSLCLLYATSSRWTVRERVFVKPR